MQQHKRLPKTLFLLACLLVVIGCSSDEKRKELLYRNDFGCSNPFDNYSIGFQPTNLGVVNRPGTYMVTVLTRVVNGSGEPQLADVAALSCDFGYWSECDVLSRAKTDSDGRSVLQIKKAFGVVYLVISQDGLRRFRKAIPRSSGGTVDLGTIVLDEEPPSSGGNSPPLVNYSGVLLDESNNPVAGIRFAPFVIQSRKPRVPIVSYSYTDAQGRFNASVPEWPGEVHLVSHSGPIWISMEETFRGLLEDKWGSNTFYLVDSREDTTVRLKSLETVNIRLIGKQPDEIDFSMYAPYPHHQHVIPISTLKLRFHEKPQDMWMRVSSTGHLSRLVKYPSIGNPLIVDFSNDKPIVVRVSSDGHPVNGARVDFIEASAGYRPKYQIPSHDWSETDSLITDSNGGVFVKGDGNSVYVACAYMESHLPSCVRLHSSVENELELSRKNKVVEFVGLEEGDYLRLKIAGTDIIEYAKPIEDEGKLSVSVAPGTYDATVARKDQGVVRGYTFEARRSLERVDLREDNRPEVTISLPELPPIPEEVRQWYSVGPIPDLDLWHVNASRKTRRGYMASGFGRLAEHYTFEEPNLEIFNRTDRSISLRLSGSGSWVLALVPRYESLDYWLMTELLADAGSSIELKLNDLNSNLTGTANFDASGFHRYGFAEPRLALTTTNPQR